MEMTEVIKTLEDNIVTRLHLFTKTIDNAPTKAMSNLISLSPQCKTIAFGEMLLFLLHYVDRLAYETDVPQKTRLTLRNESVQNLINKEILPPKITGRLIDDGIEPSLNSFGASPSAAAEALLPLFLGEIAEADKYYSQCTTFIGENLYDENGLVNKLANRILNQCEPEDNLLSRFFIITTVSDVLLQPELAKQDRKALNILR